MCTDSERLRRFVGDASRLPEWIPFTEEARALESAPGEQLYYLRTATPWPLKSRDMVYSLRPAADTAPGEIGIELKGLPDALPASEDAVRMDGAEGLWTLREEDGRIEVALRLAIDPGPVADFFANRRLAATVAGMLANLRERFPCPPDLR